MSETASAPARESVFSIEAAWGAGLLNSSANNSSPAQLISAVREGLSYDAFERLRAFLDLPAREVGALLAIPERTLARRRKGGRLTPEESDRLLRLARLSEMALAVFEGNEASAQQWLTQPKNLLGGESPLRHADTEAGAREVEDMLYAIEFTAAA